MPRLSKRANVRTNRPGRILFTLQRSRIPYARSGTLSSSFLCSHVASTSVKAAKSCEASRTYASAPGEYLTEYSTAVFLGRDCDGDRHLARYVLSDAPDPT